MLGGGQKFVGRSVGDALVEADPPFGRVLDRVGQSVGGVGCEKVAVVLEIDPDRIARTGVDHICRSLSCRGERGESVAIAVCVFLSAGGHRLLVSGGAEAVALAATTPPRTLPGRPRFVFGSDPRLRHPVLILAAAEGAC